MPLHLLPFMAVIVAFLVWLAMQEPDESEIFATEDDRDVRPAATRGAGLEPAASLGG